MTSEERARALRVELEASGRYGPIDAIDPHDGSVQAEADRIITAALDAAVAEAVKLELGEPLAWIVFQPSGDIDYRVFWHKPDAEENAQDIADAEDDEGDDAYLERVIPLYRRAALAAGQAPTGGKP